MNKYHNKKTVCLSRHIHDSKGEALYCNYLLSLKRSGRIDDYRIQEPFNLPGGIIHVVDFVVYIPDFSSGGLRKEIHEFKGFRTAVWKMKQKLFQETYPYIPYKVIVRQFQRRSRCQIQKKLRKMAESQKKMRV